jgi:hypothetical protein
MTEFMNEYNVFAYIVPGDKDGSQRTTNLSERVANLKRTFELLSNVFRTYDSLMKAVFVDGEQLELLRRFTWLLFLIARGMAIYVNACRVGVPCILERLNILYMLFAGAVISNAKDLVMLVHLVVACVHFVASRARPSALNAEFGMGKWLISRQSPSTAINSG